MKSLALETKQSNKDRRQQKVLLGLVDYYIRTGEPVGSATLRDSGFPDISSATLRNYFAALENDGYLRQQHSSGGRIPTDKAYRVYLQDLLTNMPSPATKSPAQEETREIAAYLQHAADALSESSATAVFLSAPRFDHDFVTSIKFIGLTPQRLACLLVTEFGDVQTILLPSSQKLSSFAVKRIEEYCQWRLNGINKPAHLEKDEEAFAQNLYNEIMLRYIVRYSHFIQEEVYRTGFSKLLTYPEFRDPHLLANSLALFENAHSMRLLLRESASHDQLRFWVGEDLLPYSQQPPYCTVMAIPYRVNVTAVGAIGILGPMRMPYRKLLETLQESAEAISDTLTRSLYKFKIKFRQPEQAQHTLSQGQKKLLLDKTGEL